jgi:hypothetical protein
MRDTGAHLRRVAPGHDDHAQIAIGSPNASRGGGLGNGLASP